MDKKNLPFPQRMANVQEAINKACEENDIQVVPVIDRRLQSDTVKTIFVDMQDPNQVKQFGLGNPQDDSSSGLLTN